MIFRVIMLSTRVCYDRLVRDAIYTFILQICKCRIIRADRMYHERDGYLSRPSTQHLELRTGSHLTVWKREGSNQMYQGQYQ